MTKTDPRAAVGKSTFTRRQMEALEAVFHQGSPWLKKVGPRDQPQFIRMGVMSRGGGAINRMVEDLQKRRYLTATDSSPWGLAKKGLEALGRDKIAMLAIDARELAARIAKREQIESADAEALERDRAERERRSKEREAESRAERVKRLHELFDDVQIRALILFDEKNGFKLVASDDELLALAGRIADIETIY